ncbi:S8 family serine peptidase [Halobacterium sp. KA-4]|uniref:S8 family serine peptidase n=1 Tax=Halobacterium sp. KA-4 TaxID=2896367 RepID=UPI001E590F3D|nr:S8 family serine peptidase [Halobacterium sp. KA-4]MCD2201006.1 S8 family serine peptidase [Halobacterium sp. KA-4]
MEADAASELAGVEYVTPDRVRKFQRPPNPNSSDQQGVQAANYGQWTPWGIERIGARNVAQAVPESAQANITVAVLDSGIDYSHPDLDGNVKWGANFSNGAMKYGLSMAGDNQGHGTAVAGLIAAEDNSQGIVGVAPHTELYSIKILNQNNYGYYSWWIQGIDAALRGPDRTLGTSDDADILSMSVGGQSNSYLLEDTIESASEHAIIVASASNRGDGDPATNEVGYPAKYPETIAVAATNRSDSTTMWSSEGAEVTISAPGNSLSTTARGEGIQYFSGTSAAAPIVSGTLALLMAEDRSSDATDYTNAELRTILRETAVDIDEKGVDNTAGYGLIQAEAAMDRISPETASLALRPQNKTVRNESTTTYEVVLSNATGGLGGFEALTVSINDTRTAKLTGVTPNETLPEMTSERSPDGSTLQFSLPAEGTRIEGSSFVLGTINVTPTGAGTAALNLSSPGPILTTNGERYQLAPVQNGQLTVNPDDGARVSNVTVNTTAIAPNQSVAVMATINNSGELRDTVTVTYSIGTKVVGSQEVVVNAGQKRVISKTVQLSEPGTHEISVNNVNTTQVTVSEEETGRIEDVTIDPQVVTEQSQVNYTLTGTLKNISTRTSLSVTFPNHSVERATIEPNTVDSTQTVAVDNWRINGDKFIVDIVPSPNSTIQTLAITANVTAQTPRMNSETTTAVVIATTDSTGTTDQYSAPLSIHPDEETSPKDPIAQYDANNDSQIGSFEVLAAITDYRDNQLDSFTLLEILNHYKDNISVNSNSTATPQRKPPI